MFGLDTDNSCIKNAVIVNLLLVTVVEILWVAFKLTFFFSGDCDITNALVCILISSVLTVLVGCAGS
jgi:hypothetical protein